MTALTSAAVVAPASLTAEPIRTPRARSVAPLELSDMDVQESDPANLTLTEAASLLRQRRLSPRELTDAYLARIARWDEEYRAFNLVRADELRAETRDAEAAGPSRDRPLRGLPLAIKDNFYTAGVPTTANSHLFADFIPAHDATAWARLRDAGALLLGKTQMGPLATTAATTPDGTRTTVNAWSPFDEDVSPGGSSSGTATAVAARLAPAGTGTQTGGSITNPSNAQGLTGIKPTMGRVSLQGVLPLTYTRDHVGPLARDARDAALMLQVMAGPDPADPRSLGLPPVGDYLEAVEPGARTDGLQRPTRVGVWPGYLDEPTPPPEMDTQDEEGADRIGSTRPREAQNRAGYLRRVAEIAARREMLSVLEGLGAVIVEVDAPRDWDALTSWSFNNVRLPERSEIFLEHLKDDVRGFGVSLSPWINGLLLPAAEYVRGQRAKLVLLEAILDDVLSQCDVVVQTQPFPFDMVGLPLVTFPIGFEDVSTAGPRPIGALFGGQPYDEELLLGLAAAYQRFTDWHLRRPADPDAFARPVEGEARGRIDVEDVMWLAE